MTSHLLLIHALSPIHCGTGQAISGIDLPIARERPTGTPLIPGSTLKGVLRAHPGGYVPSEKRAPLPLHSAAFGPETDKASEYAGAVQFADAHLLFLPIRSVRGTFSWITSPHLLRRFARDARECKLDWKIPLDDIQGTRAFITGERLVVKIGNKERVVFEDFDFDATKSAALETFAETFGTALFGKAAKDDIRHFVERVCIVADDVMRVLGRVGMEVIARNRIDNERKTVATGALWTEEALPIETILTGLLVATPVRGEAPATLIDHVKGLCREPIQLGGKATVGRGMCRLEVL